MAEEKTVSGGCHCGAVRFTATADVDNVIECNCSHCSRKGFLLTFTPIERFTLEAGEGSMTEYRFNTHKIGHLFCKTCGVQAFGRGVGPGGAEMAAINVRCVDGVDIAAVNRTPVDGKSF